MTEHFTPKVLCFRLFCIPLRTNYDTYRKMNNNQLFDDAVALLRELIATPRVSRDESRAADILFDRMAEWGLQPQRVKNNVFAVPTANGQQPMVNGQ